MTKQEILKDYKVAVSSRETSYLGRKEVMAGKAKFGIFGDGKELAQIAMARVFRDGDWRSGYYRDQTFMLAIGEITTKQLFAQLYAHTDVEAEPSSGGRMMNSHFGSRSVSSDGEWYDLTKMKNSCSDMSCTAAQIPRLAGLAYASKLFRNNPDLKKYTHLSNNGNEVAFGTIGNASTAEGCFFETMNAAGVLQIPMIMSVWDDEFGISVPNRYQTIKSSISKVMEGFQRDDDHDGFEIIEVKGWDYTALCEAYSKADQLARTHHIPVLVHVIDLTQPLGHSTSGSHERYKTKERLDWEKEYDCLVKMREWILEEGIATSEELLAIEKEGIEKALEARNEAWSSFRDSIKPDLSAVLNALESLMASSKYKREIKAVVNDLKSHINANKFHITQAVKSALRIVNREQSKSRDMLLHWLRINEEKRLDEYSSHLYSESKYAAISIPSVAAQYSDNSKIVDGREVVQACFDEALKNNPLVFALGEDLGKIGDVNQGFAGLQEKHGEIRVTDTGIRETSIMGQGIGAALRGMRPIVEVQYLDYLLYCIQTLSDDLASLHYRTKGGQKAPLIIRSRGHRLEGIWHSGSPMGMIINALRGIYILVPRNMTQAAGMYNTMLSSDDPALLIESLNGYRLKETLPDNVGEFKVAIGRCEFLRRGSDITIVTYGSMCRIVQEAAEELMAYGINVEIIDIQTLIPFDLNGDIVESLKNTNRLIVVDEDVSGGATAYILKNILENQKGYIELDSAPATITAKDHRTAYGSDGDYYSKPNKEDVFDCAYKMMHEYDPFAYPLNY